MNPPILRLSDTDRQRLEQLLVEFDQHWTPHHLGIVAGQLQTESPEFRAAALTELVKIDLEYRHRHEPTRIEWYLERFPELGESPSTLGELVQAEVVVCQTTGDAPSATELQQRFPSLHDQVDSLLASAAQQDEVSAIRRAARKDAGSGSSREPSDSTTSIASAAQETLPPKMHPHCQEEAGDASPQNFGRYRLLQELGRGAMGTVYLAEDTELRRRVALKRPRVADGKGKPGYEDAAKSNDWSLLERFYREAYAAATLDHPNICPVYDIGQHEGIPYITMAYVEGKTLSRVIRDSRGLNLRSVAVLLRKIAVALAEAHAKGVIHRDLKPGNIMLNHRNEPIVMDFGLARQVEHVEDRLTVDGTMIGTPGYMSPEQVDGDLQAVGPASDIYSLGVVLFELLTGRLPFQGSVAAVIGKIVRDQPPTPASLRENVPPQLEAICLKMMAKTPADRYATMSDVADALGAFVKSSGEGASSSPPPIDQFTPSPLADANSPPSESARLVQDSRWLRKWHVSAALAALIAFGLLSWALIIYFRVDKQSLVFKIANEPDGNGQTPEIVDRKDAVVGWVETQPAGATKTLQGMSPAIEVAWCPPGKFRMGSIGTPPPDANETPVDVTLTQGLWVGKCEVTQSQWKSVMGSEPWTEYQDHQAAPNNAATHITWPEANAFCRRLTESERKAGSIPADWEFRLPTEAEWEYFCRAGTTTAYSFGDDVKQLREYAWWKENADAVGERYAHEVGLLKPNPWGLYDLHGNVYEWCQDVYTGTLPGGTDPVVTAPDEGNHVNRGGGWEWRDELAHTSSNRRWTPANDRRNNVGLRVVLAKMSPASPVPSPKQGSSTLGRDPARPSRWIATQPLGLGLTQRAARLQPLALDSG